MRTKFPRSLSAVPSKNNFLFGAEWAQSLLPSFDFDATLRLWQPYCHTHDGSDNCLKLNKEKLTLKHNWQNRSTFLIIILFFGGVGRGAVGGTSDFTIYRRKQSSQTSLANTWNFWCEKNVVLSRSFRILDQAALTFQRNPTLGGLGCHMTSHDI